jgi:hypothetical protein
LIIVTQRAQRADVAARAVPQHCGAVRRDHSGHFIREIIGNRALPALIRVEIEEVDRLHRTRIAVLCGLQQQAEAHGESALSRHVVSIARVAIVAARPLLTATRTGGVLDRPGPEPLSAA